MTQINFYLRCLLLMVWYAVACLLCTVMAIFLFRNRNNNARFGRVFGPLAQSILGFRVAYSGTEWLHPSQSVVYVANHQSVLDLVSFAKIFPYRTVLIGKKEILYFPFFGLMYWLFGNILIDREDHRKSINSLNHAFAFMKRHGLSVWIFPEGTRNRTAKGLLPFKKGAFHLAIRSQMPIVPLLSHSLAPFFDLRNKRIQPGTLKVEILPPIPTAGMTKADLAHLMNETRTRMLAALDAS